MALEKIESLMNHIQLTLNRPAKPLWHGMLVALQEKFKFNDFLIWKAITLQQKLNFKIAFGKGN